MESAGDQLLARSALSLDEDGKGRGRGALHQVEDLLHRRALADEVLEAVALQSGALQELVLGGELRVHARVLDGDGRLVRERLEEGQVVPREDAPATAAVHVDGADGPFPDPQGNAHQRLDLEERDALGAVKAIVVQSIRTEDWLSLPRRAHDALAVVRRVAGRLALHPARGSDLEGPGRLVDQDDETSEGAHDPQRQVEDSIEELVEGVRRA